MGIRDRRQLSFAGHVAVSVVLDERGELVGDPEVVLIGVAIADAGRRHGQLMLDAAIERDRLHSAQRRKDLDVVQDAAVAPCAVRRRGLGQEAAGDRVRDAAVAEWRMGQDSRIARTLRFARDSL